MSVTGPCAHAGRIIKKNTGIQPKPAKISVFRDSPQIILKYLKNPHQNPLVITSSSKIGMGTLNSLCSVVEFELTRMNWMGTSKSWLSE